MGRYVADDHFARKARDENYPARSVYKLQEIDDKQQIIPRKGKVLDLGASPGSWSLYVSQKGRNKLKITAFDLKPLEVTIPGLFFHQMDVFSDKAQEIISEHGPYELIMSDMAPSTTGMKFRDQTLCLELVEKVVQITEKNLARQGNLIFKYFESEEANLFLKKLKKKFQNSTLIKPKSTRSRSYELFFVGKKMR